MQNNTPTLKTNIVVSYKSKHFPFYQAIPLLGINPREMTIHIYTNIFIWNVRSSIIHDNTKLIIMK